MPRVLLTSVCRPLGPAHGDAESVGYELLFGQVTRSQGMFSPRATHVHFSLEYVAENLDAPTTVLQYPSVRELTRELKRGYDVVGISFILATWHRAKEVVALIRAYAPGARIVLGGYGTVLPDDVLAPWCDAVCREEGVGFMRRFLEEPELPKPYRHPLVVSRLRVFGREVSRTGMIFAGLGCPNGCDFCCTSHFFGRKHIRLLPTGKDIHDVVRRYLDLEPRMSFTILDEDFLLNRNRAMEFRDCVVADGRPISIFAFASVRAISKYKVDELLEMGIDGLWIGYEGTRSGFAKQAGRPTDELFRELRSNGISVLASMIVGFPYQTPEIIRSELDGLLALEPPLCQFLIYGPTPGTPFYDRVIAEKSLRPDLVTDREAYWRKCSGFTAMVAHPAMTGAEIEAAQQTCFAEDVRRLGPSIYRSLDVWLNGYLALRNRAGILRLKAARIAREIRKAYPIFLAGRLLGPGKIARARIADLQRRVQAALGPPTLRERLLSVVALGLAAWTGLALKLAWFQHPALGRHTWRTAGEPLPTRAWRRLVGVDPGGHRVAVELRRESTVWVQVEGKLGLEGAERLAAGLWEALRRKRFRLVLDLARLEALERGVAEQLAARLSECRDRVRVVAPRAGEVAAVAALFVVHR